MLRRSPGCVLMEGGTGDEWIHDENTLDKTIRVVLFSLSGAAAETATTRIVGAANSFLSTLDDKQRRSVLFAFDDEQQRKRWSNFPIALCRAAGISFGKT